MADWLQQYSTALDARDVREQAHKPYIDAYTRLADRTSTPTSSAPEPPTSSSGPASAGTTASSSALLTLRNELASTQKARAEQTQALHTLRTEFSALQTAHTTARNQLATHARTQTRLERRLRDREDELAGKRTMVGNVQDEMVALNLQLNVAEAKAAELRRENEELVRRWMERMGREADQVNRESKWGE